MWGRPSGLEGEGVAPQVAQAVSEMGGRGDGLAPRKSASFSRRPSLMI